VTERRRVLGAVATATALLLVLLAVRPLSVERLLSIYVLLLAAIALASLTRVAQSSFQRRNASRFEQALRAREERPLRPPELVRTERELTLAVATAGHAHRRLVPLLREAAAARLYARHGVELARRPQRAHELLGDELWELVRPDRPEPVDRNGPGIPLAEIAAAIGRLERV
jgi:hypothetical protein